MGHIAPNGIIRLMRGDSFSTPIQINLGTKLNPNYYHLKAGDKLYFGLMEPNQAFEDAVVKKAFDFTSDKDINGDILLTLKPTDTEKLLVGQYYYSIKLRVIDTFGNEIVKTIVKPTLFWLEGNNPKQNNDKPYYEQGDYDIDRVIFEGGEII